MAAFCPACALGQCIAHAPLVLREPYHQRALAVVAFAGGVSVEILRGPSQWREHVRPRWAFMMAMRRRSPPLPYAQIGRMLNRDPSTIRHGLTEGAHLETIDPEFAEMVQAAVRA